MKKTNKILEDNIKLVNLSIVVLDSRVPFSSLNPLIENIINVKPVLYVFNKIDLADKSLVTQWLKFFNDSGRNVITLSANLPNAKKILLDACKKINIADVKVGQRGIRALITGVPNAGKSTLINTIAGTQRAKTGDRPAVTKDLQRIFVQDGFDLYDTPGILWHKFENQEIGARLAIVGSIRDEVLNLVDIALIGINYFKTYYLKELNERYKLKDVNEQTDNIKILNMICSKRGAIAKGGIIDLDKGASIFLQELRSNKICPFTLDREFDVDFYNNSSIQ